MSRGDALLVDEPLQRSDRLVAGFHDDHEGPLAIGVMQELTAHIQAPVVALLGAIVAAAKRLQDGIGEQSHGARRIATVPRKRFDDLLLVGNVFATRHYGAV